MPYTRLLRGAMGTGIMAYHHPDVIQALTPGEYQIGSEEVTAASAATLNTYTLQFVER
jgi:hypothetical protein